jgi:uncharacterized protein YndB with AHSA1/START domain
MEHDIEFFVPDVELPTTVLRRLFHGPIDEVFRAWTDATILQAWYGPSDFEVRECTLDLRDGGLFRIVMAHREGLLFVTKGYVDDIVAPEHFTMVMQLDAHPQAFIDIFRPIGSEVERVPLTWNLDILFERRADDTLVTLTTTYPVVADRDRFVSMQGERGWAEGFTKLDRLLEDRRST